MGKYLKQFETHQQYEAYTADTSNFITPNVSYCKDQANVVHYNPYVTCEETSVYEVIGTPTYPSTVDGADTSFDITVNYRRTDIDSACTQTVTEGTDTVTVECGQNPSTSESRVVSGTVDYHGNEIEYSVTQGIKEIRVVAKYNISDSSSPQKIVNKTSGFTSMEIDGVEQPSVTTGYTFSTTGEHTVKYTLKDPTIIVANAFYGCTALTSINIPDGVTIIGGASFSNCRSLTSINIPDGVTSIEYNAFQYCINLTSITIPTSVTSIGAQTFANCSGFTSIISNAMVAPSIFMDTFQSGNSNGTLYVPQGSSGYDVWMGTSNYYLGKYNWTKVEQ